jgi:hypothetical protein
MINMEIWKDTNMLRLAENEIFLQIYSCFLLGLILLYRME